MAHQRIWTSYWPLPPSRKPRHLDRIQSPMLGVLLCLLSFAQFEREVTAERIRDKIAASKRKGLWMGGQVPFGYDPDGRTLKINAGEVGTVRMIFELYEDKRTV